MTTIRDIARLAGVGVATASRALSGNGSVSEQSATRVRAAAQRLDYRPSSIARALSLQRSGAIGVYVPSFDGSFYSSILASIDRVLRGAGRHMVAANGCGQGTPRQEALDGIAFLRERDCDGFLVASHSLTDEDCRALMRRCRQTVVLNRMVSQHARNCFSVDHEAAGRIAARALLAAGHRDIATIAGPADAPDNLARMRGFFDELARHGVVVPDARRAEGNFEIASGEAAMHKLLARTVRRRPGFSALFAANDQMAMAAIGTLGEAGLDVPRKVSVIGYDDSLFARHTWPALTTVRIPIADVAASGCRQLLNDCYHNDWPVERRFAPSVVWRGSVGTGPHAALCERP